MQAKRLTREEEALVEAGNTDITASRSWVLVVVFLLTIAIVPLLQVTHDLRDYHAGLRETARPQPVKIVDSLPLVGQAFRAAPGGLAKKVFSANAVLLSEINRFEDDLSNEALITKQLLPPVQAIMAQRLGVGNEKAYVGRGGWLFYRPGFDYVTGPGFLDARRLAFRAAQGSEWQAPQQPDPRKAIVQFHRQLAERGITLIVVPTPIKPSIHPEKFSARLDGFAEPVQNASFQQFIDDLAREGVLVYDPAPQLVEQRAKTGAPQFLATDTHWRPEAMEFAARQLASFISEHATLPAAPSPGYRTEKLEVSSLGDIANMMQLPPDQTVFPKQTVAINQVLSAGGEMWRPSRSADVLLLGDSFTNIYSFGALGWGESAGFGEQLSLALERPVDAIVRNDAGSYATREMLSAELARGRDRLDGKSVVVYQFAARELAVGDWKLIDLELGTPQPSRFISPDSGEQLFVTGTIQEISPVPKPRSVPYRDHVVSLHLVDIETPDGPIEGGEAVVYMRSMVDNVHTKAAAYRPGQKLSLRLKSWYDVEDEYGSINRSELEDEMLQFEDPCWGTEQE